ncbi:MAG: sugar transferase [Candidatus Spyradenecus sp.]
MPRALELLLVLITLPLWGAAILLIALVLAFDRPIFFRQERPGLYGRPFTLIKFRTMRPGSEPDAERLTRLGRLLRATSLDELPELLNVLRGNMALVGPRPLLMAYLAEYTPTEHHRHDVRPGITGWAQVHGRNAITRADKVRYDLDYIARRSTAFDLYILFLTLFHLRGN